MSIAVAERNALANFGKGDATNNLDGHSRGWSGSREPCRSPSPTRSENLHARPFATSTSFKVGGEERDSKESKSAKVPRSKGSVSGSSVYSTRSRRSVSTATSVSAYSAPSSVSGSVETDHTGSNASPPSASLSSGKLPSFLFQCFFYNDRSGLPKARIPSILGTLLT